MHQNRTTGGASAAARPALRTRAFRAGMAGILAFALSGFTPQALSWADDPEGAQGAAQEAATAAAADEGAQAPDGGAQAAPADSAAKAGEAQAPEGAQAEAAQAPAPEAARAPMAPAALTELWVDGAAGDDANDGSASAALKTLAKALELQAADPSVTTIHVKGDLALSATATIPSGVTLSISDDTTMAGSGKDGITLESGAFLTCDDGKTLTMTGFKTALIVKAGAEVNDGRYNFDGNTYGFNLQGKFNGTGRDKLTVSALTEKGSTFTERSGQERRRRAVRRPHYEGRVAHHARRVVLLQSRRRRPSGPLRLLCVQGDRCFRLQAGHGHPRRFRPQERLHADGRRLAHHAFRQDDRGRLQGRHQEQQRRRPEHQLHALVGDIHQFNARNHQHALDSLLWRGPLQRPLLHHLPRRLRGEHRREGQDGR